MRSLVSNKEDEKHYIYIGRYLKFLVWCPRHGVSDYQLYNYFCEGLIMERRPINASSGRYLGDMTPKKIWELIEMLAIESKILVIKMNGILISHKVLKKSALIIRKNKYMN